MPLRLLRAFLGVTFLYAGAQKLADPGYLNPGAPDFIGTQLRNFAHGSPLGWLLRIVAVAPLATGLAVALGEIAIGLGTIVGVAPVAFAFAGLGVNLVLFFTATWHVHPYFLGSDSIYAVAWLAYAIGSVEIGRANAHAAKARRRPRAGRSDVPVGLLERREVCAHCSSADSPSSPRWSLSPSAPRRSVRSPSRRRTLLPPTLRRAMTRRRARPPRDRARPGT